MALIHADRHTEMIKLAVTTLQTHLKKYLISTKFKTAVE